MYVTWQLAWHLVNALWEKDGPDDSSWVKCNNRKWARDFRAMIPLPCSAERIIDSLFTVHQLGWCACSLCAHNDENQFPPPPTSCISRANVSDEKPWDTCSQLTIQYITHITESTAKRWDEWRERRNTSLNHDRGFKIETTVMYICQASNDAKLFEMPLKDLKI